MLGAITLRGYRLDQNGSPAAGDPATYAKGTPCDALQIFPPLNLILRQKRCVLFLHWIQRRFTDKTPDSLEQPKTKSSAAGSKKCGIGLTVLETPPHAVISIADGSPLARSHQVLQGDILIAIEDELVADATMVV